jgi:hypothetical protein
MPSGRERKGHSRSSGDAEAWLNLLVQPSNTQSGLSLQLPSPSSEKVSDLGDYADKSSSKGCLIELSVL